MLKVLFLQRLYNISDNQVEYQIKDRMSFREFIDIQSVDDVPDENTREENKMIKEGEFCWFDSAYVGTEETVKSKGLTPLIIEKGYRYKSLTEEQKENNRVKSKTRCRIEHVYGFMEQSMKGLFFRGVGIVRATFYIGFTNLVYNMCRLVQIKKYHPDLIMN